MRKIGWKQSSRLLMFIKAFSVNFQRINSNVESLTIEELERALEQKKAYLKGTQTEVAASEEELEIKKKELKDFERKLAADREKIHKEMREMRKKVEEKVGENE